MSEWHLITSEYPPRNGGVSDYTQTVAAALAAAGEEVHVWCPQPGGGANMSSIAKGVDRLFVHEEFVRFSPLDLRKLGKMLDQFAEPRHLLVQWVPHGYGYRSMNFAFCLWLWHRATRKRDRVELMVHEPFLAFGEGSAKQDVAAAVHRAMIVVLLQAASRVWVSIPDWERQLRPFVIGAEKKFEWLPVPSNIPRVGTAGVPAVREQYASPDNILVGHFGAYDQYMTDLMLKLVPALLASNQKISVLFMGRGSLELRTRLAEENAQLSRRIYATGPLTAENISQHVSACDLMLQPYQDGVSGRRTSVMTALSHGTPVVTSTGKATESCWAESRAVVLTPPGDIDAMVIAANKLSGDAPERQRLSGAGRALYEERFDVTRTIAALKKAETNAEATTTY